HMITLPLQAEGDRWFSVISRYDRFLKNPGMPQQFVPAIVDEAQVRVAGQDVKISFEGDMEKIRSMLRAQIES
ncbi:MAG TPA: hypothetical protein VFO86_12385, partial [Terriglobia bacterium]|nr:hypothetical protein [Terriglobia bacterium]